MQILSAVKRLVERLAPTQVCAPCIAERVEGPNLEEIGLALSELAAAREFERDNADCGICGEHRLTIRKK
ncbi:hypothetical protein WG901_20875 [Novosphingobium sp. PS1R-30]|uniref:Uncharacterized protein n=1 Tax=Novosphingobium anseongense TaxID=3133436 RepID=A0ABU8S1G6_9SPHN